MEEKLARTPAVYVLHLFTGEKKRFLGNVPRFCPVLHFTSPVLSIPPPYFIPPFYPTHHMKCRMNRKAPGTTRSSLPTLQRRRNTTIPGISRRVVVAAFVVAVFHPTTACPPHTRITARLARRSVRQSRQVSGGDRRRRRRRRRVPRRRAH